MDLRLLNFFIILVSFSSVQGGSSTTLKEEPLATIDVEVHGKRIVQSGTRRYTLFGQDNALEYVKCSIATDSRRNLTLLILKGNETLEDINVSFDGGTLSWKFIFEKSGRTPVYFFAGIYTCKFMSSFSHPSTCSEGNNVKLSYVIDSAVEVVTTTESGIYTSSVGDSVYINETISLFCGGSTRQGVTFETHSFDGAQRTVEVAVLDDKFEMPICTNLRPRFRIIIKQELKVTLNKTSNSDDYQLSCTSYPPRLLNWIFKTPRGDNVHVSNLSKALVVDTNMTITQRPGETSLSITNTSILTEVNTIVCYTYNTTKQITEEVHINFDSNLGCEETQTSPVTDNFGTTETSSKHGNHSHGTADLNSTEAVLTTDDIYISTSSYPSLPLSLFWSLSLSTSAVVVIIIFMIVMLFLFNCFRNTELQPSSDNGVEEGLSVGSDVLENPAYIPYSDSHISQLT